MFRLGLVTYLVIATLAGPALCCCTTARLLASLSSPASKHAQDCPAPVTSCCRHSSTPQDNQPPAEKNHHPDGPQCPCKQDGQQPALALSELDNPGALLLRLAVFDGFALPLFTDSPSLLPGAAQSAAGDHRLLPFLSTQDILFSHHMLRC